MKNQEEFRSSSDRFINFERRYSLYFVRRGSYFEEHPLFARSLYQAAAHCVELISYAFAKLGVIEVVILPYKASKSGLSVYRKRRGEVGVIRRLTDVKDRDISVSEILAQWDGYNSITHFIG